MAPPERSGFDLRHLLRRPVRPGCSQYDRRGTIRAVIANSGCANACTGERGTSDARRMAELTALGLGCRADQVLVLSTGVIGRTLDLSKLEPGIRAVTRDHGPSHAAAVAHAIM